MKQMFTSLETFLHNFSINLKANLNFEFKIPLIMSILIEFNKKKT